MGLRRNKSNEVEPVSDDGELKDEEGSWILRAIDAAITDRWDNARDRAKEFDPKSLDHQAELVSKAFARELGMVGAAVGATAAAPGVGTGIAVAATAGDVTASLVRSTDLILTIGALHGHDRSSVEERRLWVMSVLAFGSTASTGMMAVAGEAGIGLGKKATAAIPMTAIRAINRLLGRTVITKYGTKRGAIALARLLPFGFGMVIGGTANYAITKRIGAHAHKFFNEMPEILQAPGPVGGDGFSDDSRAVAATLDTGPVRALTSSNGDDPLERYRSTVAAEVLDQSDEFVCATGAICRASAEARGFGLAAGQLSYIGESYDQAPFRVLVVSMQVGDAEAPVTIERRAEQIASVVDGKRNPHMRGVTRALQLLFGLDLDEERLDREHQGGIHVLDAYAMANSTLCSALPTEGRSRRGEPTSVMLDNCSHHLEATIDALKPSVIVSQGAGPEQALRSITTDLSEVTDTLRRVTTADGTEALLCSLSHPAAGPPKSWSSLKPGSHFDTVVRPTLEQARNIVVASQMN